MDRERRIMPRIRGYTPEQRQLREGERWLEIIKAKCRWSPYRSLPGLAAAMDVSYNTLYDSIRKGRIRAITMKEIIRMLDMTNEDVLTLMGRRKA